MSENYNFDDFPIEDKETLSGKLVAAFGGQIGAFLFGFITAIVIARTLGPAGKGAFSLIVLIVNLVFNFVHGSIGAANSHFVGRFNRHVSGIIGNSFLLVLFWGGAITMLFISFADVPLEHFYPNVDRSLVKLAALCIPALVLFEYASNIVRGQNRIRQYSLILVFKELSFLAALVALILFATVTVASAVHCWMFGIATVGLFAGWAAWSGNNFRLKLDFPIWKPMAKFGLQAHTANLASFLKTRIDWLLIPFFLDNTALGYYSNASAIILVLWFLPTAVAQILGPHISWRDNHSGDMLTPVLCRITFFITCITGVLLVVFGRIGIRIAFGAEFLPSYAPLVIMIPGAVLYGISKLLSGDLTGRGLPHYAMKISTAVLIINVIMNFLLIPTLGIAGAAFAATVSYGANGVLFLLAFRRESRSSLYDALVMKRADFELITKSLKSWRAGRKA